MVAGNKQVGGQAPTFKSIRLAGLVAHYRVHKANESFVDKPAVERELMKEAQEVVKRHTSGLGRRMDVESYVLMRLAVGLLASPTANLKPSGYHRDFIATVFHTFIDGVRMLGPYERRRVAIESEVLERMMGGAIPPLPSWEDGEHFRTALTSAILDDLAESLPDPLDRKIFGLIREGKSDATVAEASGLTEGRARYRRQRMIAGWRRRPKDLEQRYGRAYRLIAAQMRAQASSVADRRHVRGGS